MKRLIALSIALLICLLPQAGFAHSKLVSSTPAANTTVTEKIDELRLTYNTTIEPGSTLTVTDQRGQKIPVAIQVQDKDLIAQLTNRLPNGVIRVQWKIIGEDGHLIKGDYQFTYQVKQPDTAKQKQPEQNPEPQKKQSTTIKTTAQPAILPWLVAGLLAVLIMVSVILFIWKGKKKQ